MKKAEMEHEEEEEEEEEVRGKKEKDESQSEGRRGRRCHSKEAQLETGHPRNLSCRR